MSIADAMEEPTLTEFLLSEALSRKAEREMNLKLELKGLAKKWLVETGSKDLSYKNITPYDAAKRDCARELIAKLELM